MDFSKLLSLEYLFDKRPSLDFAFLYPLLITFLMMILIGIILHVLAYTKIKNPILRRKMKQIPIRLYGFGITGLILLAFRYEGAPFLSMRFLMIVFGIIFIWWLIVALLSLRGIPDPETAKAEALRQKRYQP